MVSMGTHIADVENIFDSAKTHHSCSTKIWQAMCNAYGKNGECEKVKRLMKEMQNVLVSDKYGWISLPNAYIHAGDDAKAEQIWAVEIKDDAIRYDKYVMGSLVDWLCRAR